MKNTHVLKNQSDHTVVERQYFWIFNWSVVRKEDKLNILTSCVGVLRLLSSAASLS